MPKKHCAIEKKTISKQFCEKRCKPSLKLDLPEIKLPSLAQQNPNPSAPPAALAANPSAVPATLQAEPKHKLHLSKSAALSVSLGDASASVDASASLDVNGRRLQTLPKADLDVVSAALLLLLIMMMMLCYSAQACGSWAVAANLIPCTVRLSSFASCCSAGAIAVTITSDLVNTAMPWIDSVSLSRSHHLLRCCSAMRPCRSAMTCA